MSESANSRSEVLPEPSGSKAADDFIEQQSELLPHNVPARAADQKLEGAAKGAEDEGSQVEAPVPSASRTLIQTTPPQNDAQDIDLYSGDRQVIFVGTSLYFEVRVGN